MRKLIFRFGALFKPVLIGVWLMCAASLAVADNSVIDKIKSVYIYNFISFIQWPKPKVEIAEYQLCVIADSGLISKLKSVVVNETMNGLPLVVLSLTDKNPIVGCHLLYVQGKREIDSTLLSEASMSGTLVIGDAISLTYQDFGMVGFETRGRKVRVAVNLTRLQNAGFKVSSKLLRIVRIVR